MYSNSHSNALVARLTQRAEKLEYDWSDAGLSDDFNSLMIAAVLRFLDKVGTRRPDGTERTPSEQIDFAEAQLNRFWARNARRHFARRQSAIERGRLVAFVSLEYMAEHAAATRLYDPLQDDLLSGETGRETAQFLEGSGWSPEQAWAFVWRKSGRMWDEVAFLISERLGTPVTEGQIRKWDERYFKKTLPNLRAFLEGCDSGLLSTFVVIAIYYDGICPFQTVGMKYLNVNRILTRNRREAAIR